MGMITKISGLGLKVEYEYRYDSALDFWKKIQKP
jgi:hypothetical protein